MNSLELFSGAGGLAKGIELAGFKHAAFVENNKHAYASLLIGLIEEVGAIYELPFQDTLIFQPSSQQIQALSRRHQPN